MESKPHCLIVMGMAGSGKSSFVKRLYATLAMQDKEVLGMNLDPAIRQLSFPAHIDICTSINFPQLMQEYSLGPNGGILTALNAYATRFNEAVALLKARTEMQYILVDTPGQMEAFSWSASGMIITDALASEFPTTLIYVIDSTRVQNPNSFMSNMLYATSVYFKTRLPLLLVFTKNDLAPADEAFAWMDDFEVYMASLDRCDSYVSSLNRSLALVIDEFYKDLPRTQVSSYTGAGFDQLEEVLAASRQEYLTSYLPELQARRASLETQRQDDALTRFEEERQQDAEGMEAIQKLMAQVKMSRNELS